MLPSYNQMADWVEEISASFPDEFFSSLHGGIQLEEGAKPDPDFPPGEMYVMGEYHCDHLGRYIVLYYGSFAALFSNRSPRFWREEIFRTIAHEFTHHLERDAMLHALEDKDDEFIKRAKERLSDS